MANTIKIKRSTTTVTPGSLEQGELAYSESTGTGNGELFIGIAGAALEKIAGFNDVTKLLTIDTNADVTAEANVTSSFPLDDATVLVYDNADNTKRMRIDVGAVGTGVTRVVTVPNQDITLAHDGDLVHVTGAENIGGNKTFDNDVIVTGNFTVNGTTTSVNTETVTIDDNIMVLNNNEAGTPSQDAGLEIERGTSTNARMLFEESTDLWKVDNGSGSLVEISLLGHQHTLADGATDVTAVFGELNLLDLSGLTAGWVLSADTASTASWKAPSVSSEVNDLTASVTWQNIPIANVPTGTTGTTVSLGNHTHAALYQPLATPLTAIAALSSADSNFIVGSGSGWVAETGATVRTSLGLAIGTDVQTFTKNNFIATAAPAAATDDVTLGYSVGSIWIDVTGDVSYIAVDVTDGAAVWVQSGSAGAFTPSSTDTLTNKTINTASNTITIVEADISDLGTYLLAADIDDAPVNGELAQPISSNWAFDHDIANEHIDHSAVSITAGVGLTGGGDLTITRTVDLDTSTLTIESGIDGAADYVPYYDTAVGMRKVLLNDMLDGGTF